MEIQIGDMVRIKDGTPGVYQKVLVGTVEGAGESENAWKWYVRFDNDSVLGFNADELDVVWSPESFGVVTLLSVP